MQKIGEEWKWARNAGPWYRDQQQQPQQALPGPQ